MKRSRRNWSFTKFFLRVLSLLLGVVTLLFVFLGTYGVPDWLLSDILQKVDTGQFTLETSQLKLSLYGDLVFRDIRVFRKFVIGPPILQADRLTVVIDPYRVVRGQSVLRGIRVADGAIRTPMITGQERTRSTFADLNIDLDLLLENCTVDGMSAASFRADIDCKGSTIIADNISARLTEGENAETFRGVLTYNDETKELKGNLDTDFKPERLLPYLEQEGWVYIPELIGRFEFAESMPKCSIAFLKTIDSDRHLSLSGKVWLPECKYRGVPILRADGSVDVKISETEFSVRVDPLFVIRSEGSVRGWLSVDLENHNFMYDCASAVQPDAMLKMAGVYQDELMRNCIFSGPVEMESNGRIDIKDPSKRFVNVNFNGRNVGLNEGLAEECSFNMKIIDNIVQLTNIAGRIYGGTFSGDLGFELPSDSRTNIHYKVNMTVDNMRAPEALEIITKKDMSHVKGKLYSTISMRGSLGAMQRETAEGKGMLGIKDGHVFSLPVFGGLSSMMRKILPGLDFVLRQNHMKTHFTVKDGRVHFSDVKIEGDVLSLSGSGDYYFDKRLDFDVRVQLLQAHTAGGKLMRMITYPISKLFEFRLKGTSDEPKWYPVNFSSDLLETLGI